MPPFLLSIAQGLTLLSHISECAAKSSEMANRTLNPCDPGKHLTSTEKNKFSSAQVTRQTEVWETSWNSAAKHQGSFVTCEALAENSKITSVMAELYHKRYFSIWALDSQLGGEGSWTQLGTVPGSLESC